jgi:hypothetical protein
MENLLAGLIGAVIGLGGVAVGAWLQGLKEHQRWLRDQKLRAAISYIGATGEIYDRRRYSTDSDPTVEEAALARAQDARSALYLLCDSGTVEVAEALIQRVRHMKPNTSGQHDDDILALLRDLVQRLRLELGAGTGQLLGARSRNRDRPGDRGDGPELVTDQL